MSTHFEEIRYGFEYGPAIVTRLASDKEKDWVVIGIETAKHNERIQIHVSRDGQIKTSKFHES